MIINSINMPNFINSEFSENPHRLANKQLLINLQKYRDYIDMPFVPSPVSGALARSALPGNNDFSLHVVFSDSSGNIIRKSKAIDGFPVGDIFKAWIIAQQSGLWGGMGIYFDTKLKNNQLPMLHLDLRKNPLIWFRNDHNYCYPDSKDFYKELLNLFFIHRNDYKKVFK